MYWEVLETATLPSAETLIRLQLCSSEETKAYWPHDFCAQLTVVVGLTLKVTLKVTNTSSVGFDYSCALHSYFNLSSIDNLLIQGLQNTTYYDQLSSENGFQEEELLTVLGPTTRHYLDTESPVILEDSIFRRRILVEKEGSKVTTVWNPWEETCAKIEDLPDDGFETFVCVVAVNAFNNMISLSAGESHETSAMIGLER
jgi:glucose-6-phosphate 1-epimerase